MSWFYLKIGIIKDDIKERTNFLINFLTHFVQRYPRMNLQSSILFQSLSLEEETYLVGAIQEILIFILL